MFKNNLKNRLKPHAPILGLILVLVLLPIINPEPGFIYVVNMIFLLIIPAMSLNVIMSTGHVNFAHSAFFAMGAYTSTFLAMKAGLPFWLCLPLAGVVNAIVALGLGWIILRIKGPYFFLVTVAFGEMFIRSLTYFKNITGGHQGIEHIPRPSITIPHLINFTFASEFSFYYLMLAVMLVSVFVMHRLQKGHWGLTWRAAREADVVAESAGVNVIRYKVMAFAVGTFFAGIGGSLYAHYVTFINPGTFGMLLMFSILFSVIVGGREYFYGPIIGMTLLRTCSTLVARMAIYEQLIYGIIILIVILVFPGGVASLPQAIIRRWPQIANIFRRKSSEPTTN